MTERSDLRISELKLIENVADGTWASGLSTADSSQTKALGVTRSMYADMILTLIEDGYLHTRAERLRDPLKAYEIRKGLGTRSYVLAQLTGFDSYYEFSVTYRGVRRIDELRESLRRDRILERFGILLDGRYVMTDLIRLLEDAEGEPVSFIFLDVDRFGALNREHGYQAADEVLRHVERTVKRSIGNRGEAYRRGGDEIVALLPYCGAEASVFLAQRVCEEIANSVVTYEGKDLQVTLSVGVAASPPFDADGPALEAHAYNAMQRAKRNGKNRVAVA